MPSHYRRLSHEQLATLVPELLLVGHLADRSGMPFCLAELGHAAMNQVAIEEWAAASPVYTRRMQQAMGFTGDDVVTIFKGLQLDIGAPPQFMDFRFAVQDRWHGTFNLAHCGALMDVEPMGEEFVRGMCHDIEDPTFDATAVATNPRARMRPVHRPPRQPADRQPHCAWEVVIDEESPEVEPVAALAVTERSRAATLVLDPVDPTEPGRADYTGELVSDLDFAAFSHSALVRLADEVALQMHLLTQGFHLAVDAHVTDPAQRHRVVGGQLVGHAGLAGRRLARALGLRPTVEDAALLLTLHPVLNPAAYVVADGEGATVTVRPSPAHEDGGWLTLCGPGAPEPLQAAVRGLDPHLDVVVEGTSEEWTARVVLRDDAAPEAEEVSVARLSHGADFAFEPRRSLPVTVL